MAKDTSGVEVASGLDAFCPLIGGECRADCVCFVPEREEEIPDKYAEEPRYRTVPARCANKLLGG